MIRTVTEVFRIISVEHDLRHRESIANDPLSFNISLVCGIHRSVTLHRNCGFPNEREFVDD